MPTTHAMDCLATGIIRGACRTDDRRLDNPNEDRLGDDIGSLFGCECDLDFRCSVPECEMRFEFELRHMSHLYRVGALDCYAPREPDTLIGMVGR